MHLKIRRHRTDLSLVDVVIFKFRRWPNMANKFIKAGSKAIRQISWHILSYFMLIYDISAWISCDLLFNFGLKPLHLLFFLNSQQFLLRAIEHNSLDLFQDIVI